jgi:hypothetical protein
VLFGNGGHDNFDDEVKHRSVHSIKPVLVGEWFGIKILTSPEPCLECGANWMPFMPPPLPETVSLNFLLCSKLVRKCIVLSAVSNANIMLSDVLRAGHDGILP